MIENIIDFSGKKLSSLARFQHSDAASFITENSLQLMHEKQ